MFLLFLYLDAIVLIAIWLSLHICYVQIMVMPTWTPYFDDLWKLKMYITFLTLKYIKRHFALHVLLLQI